MRQNNLSREQHKLPAFVLLGTLVFSIQIFSKPKGWKIHTKSKNCPGQIEGIINESIQQHTLEDSVSLKKIKKNILNRDKEKFKYLSHYQLTMQGNRNIHVSYSCPIIKMKLHVLNPTGAKTMYETLIDEDGNQVDPNYAVFAGIDWNVSKIPYLALQKNKVDQGFHKRIVKIFNQLDIEKQKLVSEIIVDRSNELILILSKKESTTSVFLGSTNLEVKTTKLDKFINYLEKNNRVFPKMINLTNTDKVVVKF